MFIEESLWIKAVLKNLNLMSGSTVLDIGSSTAQFRQLAQLHIDSNVFYPLRQCGCKIYHLDSKQGDGVDIVFDIDDPSIDPIKSIGVRFDLVICTNLLEHVLDIKRVAGTAADLVKERGYLLLSVPRYYKEHPDPIDTMYRPSTEKLEALIHSIEPALVTIAKEVVTIKDRVYYPIHESHWPFWGYRYVLRYWFPWMRWKVSCILFQKKQNSLA